MSGTDETSLRLFIQSVDDYAILMLDEDGNVASWNAGAERLKGYAAAEILGRHFSVFYADEDVAAGKPARELEIAAAEGRLQDVGWRLRKDGSRFWANVVITALRDAEGVLLGYGKVTRDLTEQRVAEQLRVTADHFKSLLEASPDGIVVVDERGLITTVNARLEEMFGYRREELLGKPVEILMPGHSREERPLNPAQSVTTADRSAARPTIDLHAVRKDGSEFPVEISANPLVAETGALTLRAIRDVTDRKLIEAELTEYRDHLEELVRDRTEALTIVNGELEAFSYTVSHDLRAPLRSLAGFSDALMEDHADVLDEDGLDYLTRINAAAQRMSELLDGLLTLSRLARSEFKREPVDISAIVHEITDDLQVSEPERQVRFKIAADLAACGDADLIRVTFENLLQNAWKFTSEQPAAVIEIGTTELDGVSAFFVSDDGVGFDMTYAATLFGVFKRLHGEHEFPGMGVGLATVARVVARHGGRIVAEGSVGGGATFTFTL
jgi:PAS domain S-box-containing protein